MPVGGLEDRGLVHVVPDAGHAHVEQDLVQPAPPVAGRRLAEVREDAVVGVPLRLRRPHRRLVDRAVGVLHEVIAGEAGVVGDGARLLLRVGVEDGDGAEAVRAQVGDEALGIGEAHRVPGEGREAVLVVDVEPDHVGGDAPLAEVVGDEADLRLRVVAVPALVEAERPARGHRHAAGERGVALHHLARASAHTGSSSRARPRRCRRRAGTATRGPRRRWCARCCPGRCRGCGRCAARGRTGPRRRWDRCRPCTRRCRCSTSRRSSRPSCCRACRGGPFFSPNPYTCSSSRRRFQIRALFPTTAIPRSGSSSSSDSPAAVAKETRKGSWRIVTLRAEVVITDCAAPTSNAAWVDPRARLTTA